MCAINIKRSIPHKTILGVLGFALLLTLSQACPNTIQCACEDTADGKSVVNCRNKGLTEVPSFNNDPSPYYELTLAINEITTLPNMAFSGLNIKRLDLSQNGIFSISNNAFNGLENSLEELVLHVDQMVEIPSAALRGLTKLKLIELKGFDIQRLPVGLFATNTQLSNIALTGNSITSLTASVFNNIQAVITHLDISSNLLKTLPVSVLQSLPNLKVFKIKQNEITTIANDAFSSNSLTELDLSLLGIDTIQENAFRGLEQSLITLDLSKNKLTDFQVQPLKSLQRLQQLNLASNSIMTLPRTVFQNTQNLKSLDISVNSIGSVTRETMQNLATSLEKLHLGENVITSIETGSFDNFNQLIELDMKGQNLRIVLNDKNILSGLGNLEILNLNYTSFSNDNWPVLNVLSNLVTLTLSHNSISNIPDMAFLYKKRLETLNLEQNSLRDFTQKSVYGLQKTLKKIDLSSNSLSTISHCVFDDFTFRNDLHFLNLDSNPLDCDCQAKWMRQWIDDNTDQFTKFIIQWTCQSPQSLQGKKIYEVEQNQMVCNPGFTEPPCEDLTPTSTTSSTTTAMYQPMLLNVTEVTDRSVTIAIIVSHSDMTGYTVEYFVQGSDILAGTFDLDREVRSFDIPGLKSSTNYLTCVIMYLPDSNQDRSCTDFVTKLPVAPVTPGSATQTLAIALGATFGIIAFIIILVVIICCCRRKCKEDEDFMDGKGIPERGEMPAMGYNSKRFSKPTSSSAIMDEKELEKKLQFFAPEERDRIWNVLTNTGGSTMSIISTGSNQRYVPDIQMSHYNPNRPPQLPDRPVGFGGYLNPQEVKDEDHHYHEIPEEFKQNAAMANPDPYANTGASSAPPVPYDNAGGRGSSGAPPDPYANTGGRGSSGAPPDPYANTGGRGASLDPPMSSYI